MKHPALPLRWAALALTLAPGCWLQRAPQPMEPLERPAQELQVSSVQAFQEIGGLVGRFILALLVVRILSRRNLIRVFQIPGLIVMPLVFLYAAMNDLTLLKYGAFLIGLLTVAQFSFWGNYLPGVYPVYLRGTGEGFAAKGAKGA